MTRDDIIRMGREAGITSLNSVWLGYTRELERFAHLVAAAEREACAALCFQMWNEWINSRVGNETLDNSNCPDAEDCAFAIRERDAS
jgi:hypothetical protein